MNQLYRLQNHFYLDIYLRKSHSIESCGTAIPKQPRSFNEYFIPFKAIKASRLLIWYSFSLKTDAHSENMQYSLLVKTSKAPRAWMGLRIFLWWISYQIYCERKFSHSIFDMANKFYKIVLYNPIQYVQLDSKILMIRLLWISIYWTFESNPYKDHLSISIVNKV